MQYSLTEESVRVLTWLQWSGSICEERRMYWTGAVTLTIVPILSKFFGKKINLFEKYRGRIHEKKYHLGDINFIRGALADGWKFRCGDRKVPASVLRDKNLFKVYLQSVFDSIGAFRVKNNNMKNDAVLRLSLYHLQDSKDIIKGLKRHSLPIPRFLIPDILPSRGGYQLSWPRDDTIALLDYIDWTAHRISNANVMKYLQEDRDFIKRQFS